MRAAIVIVLLLAGIVLAWHGIYSMRESVDPYARWASLIEAKLGAGIFFVGALVGIGGAIRERPWMRPAISAIGMAAAFVLILYKMFFEK